MININEAVEHTKELSILFVEDHEELRISTTNMLQKLFKDVDVSPNGQEALKQYNYYYSTNSKNYDIVLSDIRMPLMNGIELTREIYKVNPEQSIIILSAYDETQYLLELINLGIEQFIKKPINYDELLKSFLNVSKKFQNNTKKAMGEINSTEIQLDKDVVYSKETKSIQNKKENIYLTKFEIIFIELLAQSFGKIYSNEDIVLHYASVDEVIDASNIRKLVSKLRKKLPENCIESIYAIGYKFIPLV